MPWYDGDYSYKKKITIDHTKVAGDEVDFPVLVSVTDGDLADEGNGGHVKSANGYDIIFSNSAENAQLKHEIERYVNTSGLLVFWVKLPAISSSAPDTEFYIYYGKAGVGADPSSTDTWESNYMMVQHMKGSQDTDCDDSTSNDNDVDADTGDPTYEQVGKTGYAIDFDGNDYLNVPDSDTLSFGDGSSDDPFTLSAWVYMDDATDFLFLSKSIVSAREWTFFVGNLDKVICQCLDNGSTPNIQILSDDTITGDEDNWILLTVTYDGSSTHGGLILYRNNAVLPATTSEGGTYVAMHNQPHGLHIGEVYGWGGSDGKIDEVRISRHERSANWISTSFESQDDPSSFCSNWGGEEAILFTETLSDTVNISDNVVFKHKVFYSDAINISDSVLFKRLLALADSVNVSDIVAFKHSITLSDSISVSDSIIYKHLIAIADSIGISDALVFKHFIYLIDSINISESIQAGHFISIYDSVSISDNITFKYSLFILDNISISDSIAPLMLDVCGSLFRLHTDTYDIYLPMPEPSGESRTLNKDIKLFDFWTDERDTIDVGITDEPITLNGTISACTDDKDVEMTIIAAKFSNIHDMANRHEEVTITELGDCYDAVYVIKSFRYNTIRRSPYAFAWQLVLEYVRAI